MKQIPDKAKIQTFFFLLHFREQIFLRLQMALRAKGHKWETRKGGRWREIVSKKNGRALAGKHNNGYYCFLGRMKGLCPWLVLIGLTPLNLVKD